MKKNEYIRKFTKEKFKRNHKKQLSIFRSSARTNHGLEHSLLLTLRSGKGCSDLPGNLEVLVVDKASDTFKCI